MLYHLFVLVARFLTFVWCGQQGIKGDQGWKGVQGTVGPVVRATFSLRVMTLLTLLNRFIFLAIGTYWSERRSR